MHQQSTNHISLKNRPRCHTKSPTAQDAFWPIPGLIRCAGVTVLGDGDCYITHKMQSDGWPYSKSGTESSKAPSLRAAVLHAVRTLEYADGTNTQKSPQLGTSHAVILLHYRMLVVLYSTYLVQIRVLLDCTTHNRLQIDAIHFPLKFSWSEDI